MKGKIAKRLAKVCMMVLVLSCSLGSITQAEETISFTAVSSIKIGEELAGKIQYQNASEGMTPTIGLSKEDGESFWLTGSGGPMPVFPSNGSTNLIFQQNELGTTYCGEAIKVGTVQAKCYATYDDCWQKKEPIATYPITIEEPIITTNVKETCYVGDKVQFNTKLTNVALKEGKLEELKAIADPNITGFFTYQAKTEIIEGQNLVDSENTDYSNLLSSTEELSFTGEGNVKIKITYMPVSLLDLPDGYGLTDEDGRDLSKEIYIPEKIVTIHVADTKKMLNDEISNIMKQNLEEDKYTVESWNAFYSVLESAKSVLNSDSATNEERINAYEALIIAKDGLRLKETKPAKPTEEPSKQPKNPSGNNSTRKVISKKVGEIPKTGDNNGIIMLTIFALGSLIVIGRIYAKGARRIL